MVSSATQIVYLVLVTETFLAAPLPGNTSWTERWSSLLAAGTDWRGVLLPLALEPTCSVMVGRGGIRREGEASSPVLASLGAI
jgi:hypothetical protein